MYLKISFRNIFPAFFAMSAFALVSCGSNETSTADEKSDTTTVTDKVENETNATAEAVLSGTQQDTTVTGTVRFTEDDHPTAKS